MGTSVQDVHHWDREDVRSRATKVAVECYLKSISARASRGHRHRENRVRPKTSLIGGAIKFDHLRVDRALIGGVHPAKGLRNLAVHVLDRRQHTLSFVALLVAAAQFDGFVLSGGRAARNDSPRACTATQ